MIGRAFQRARIKNISHKDGRSGAPSSIGLGVRGIVPENRVICQV